jgi:hypothetical protein
MFANIPCFQDGDYGSGFQSTIASIFGPTTYNKYAEFYYSLKSQLKTPNREKKKPEKKSPTNGPFI